MDINERIARFEQMVTDDPENDIAIFSLAGALNQAGRFDDAARRYERCTELNPAMSKAYQLAGAAFMAANRTDDAARILTEGYRVASERGDLMPKRAMADLLAQLGVALPEDAAAPASGGAGEGDMTCHATGQRGHRMAKPPFRGPIGLWIVEHIARETFDEWVGIGTKVINELRLDLSQDAHDAVYDYAMRRFLRLDDDMVRSLTGSEPPMPTSEYRTTVDQMLGRLDEIERMRGELYQRVGKNDAESATDSGELSGGTP